MSSTVGASGGAATAGVSGPTANPSTAAANTLWGGVRRLLLARRIGASGIYADATEPAIRLGVFAPCYAPRGTSSTPTSSQRPTDAQAVAPFAPAP